MASRGAFERKGGVAERRRRRRDKEERATCGSNGGFFYEDDSADDELGKLMPTLKRRLEALEEDQGSFNFMGELNMTGKESFGHNDDKENAASNRNSFRQSRKRRGTGQGNAAWQIDFDKLLKTAVSPPSGGLNKNGTTALKENVNRAELHSQNVDVPRSIERQKKISAVTRRRLEGNNKTPAETKPKPVEDRNARHARSRRGGADSRESGRRSINLDLYIDAAKIAEWDKETLAEEEITPSTRANCGAFLSAGRPALQSNLADLDQGRTDVAVQPAREDEIQPEGKKPNLPSEAPTKMDSPSSPSDMELSVGESPLTDVPDILSRRKHRTDYRQDSGSVHPDFIMEEVFWQEPSVADIIILDDSDDMETVGRRLSSSPGRCVRQDHDSNPKAIVLQDPPPRDSNLEENPPLTPSKGFPILDGSNLQIQHVPGTSPTPPSNPVAVYMSLRHLDADLQQRRLAFLSSPSSETMETSGSREEQESDFGELQSSEDLSPGMDQLMSFTKEEDEKCGLEGFDFRTNPCNFELDQRSTSDVDVEDENMDLMVPESRRDSHEGGLCHTTASKVDVGGETIELVEAESRIYTSPGGLHHMTASKDDFQGVKMVFGEGELLEDLCNRREHRISTSKDDVQGEKAVSGEFEWLRDSPHCVTHQMSALGDTVQVEELDNRDNILPSSPCDGGTRPEDDEVRNVPEESLFVDPCNKWILHIDDEVNAQKAGEEAERDQMDSQNKPLQLPVQGDDNKSCQDQIFNTNACDPGLGEDALRAIWRDYLTDDEDLEVPDVKEPESVHHDRNGTSLAEQTEPNRLAPNREESLKIDDVAIGKEAQILTEKLDEKLDETSDSEAAPACFDAQQKNAPAEGVIEKDEGSTTHTGPKKSKGKRPPKPKDSRRSSLEESGSTWTDGQRRSQRRRVRPLEWWRGEKLLYGRIHESLTTVIGIKHSSPGKYASGIKNPFRVESYVPAKYSELVRFAAI